MAKPKETAVQRTVMAAGSASAQFKTEFRKFACIDPRLSAAAVAIEATMI